MQVEGFPSSLVSLTQKQDFVKAVLKWVLREYAQISFI